MSASQIECTNSSVCYENGQYCVNCDLRTCAGTYSSCNCLDGRCASCLTGESCTNRTCVKPLTLSCTPSWTCGPWSECSSDGRKTRICTDSKNCFNTSSRPSILEYCVYTAPAIPSTGTGNVTENTGTSGDTSADVDSISTPEDNETETDSKFMSGKNLIIFGVIGALVAVALIGVFLSSLGKRAGGNKASSGIAQSSPAKPINKYDDKEGVIFEQPTSTQQKQSRQSMQQVEVHQDNSQVTMQQQRMQQPAQQQMMQQPMGQNTSAPLTKLDSFVKACLDKGIPPEQIKTMLLGKGWKEEMIMQSLGKFGR
jgi:hypothetical protein